MISSLIHRKFGIKLTNEKRPLIIERLRKVLVTGKFKSFREYYEYVVSDESGQALLEMVDRISTNHTFFFREAEHFHFLETQVLPKLIEDQKKKQEKKIRIWSAGCSSGQEAYSIGITAARILGRELADWDLKILATDISSTVLREGETGVYRKEQLNDLPKGIRGCFFRNLGDDLWEVTPEIKKLVLFRRLNLINEKYPFHNSFQIIFCRNVMIYFDEPTKQAMVQRLFHYLEPGGYFFTGHAEFLGGRSGSLYQYVRPAVYQKNLPEKVKGKTGV